MESFLIISFVVTSASVMSQNILWSCAVILQTFNAFFVELKLFYLSIRCTDAREYLQCGTMEEYFLKFIDEWVNVIFSARKRQCAIKKTNILVIYGEYTFHI